ncbi:1032_t:CDS:1, partial [Dentiscutata heterogama]
GLKKNGVKVNESTITRILQTKDQRLSNEIVNLEAKRHRAVTVPELELALKEFIL